MHPKHKSLLMPQSSATTLSILIIGGYGSFGGRLAQALQDCHVTLYIAGRSLQKAQQFCQSLAQQHAHNIAVCFDRESNVSHQLIQINPQMVVDAAGPFQGTAQLDYAVVRACIAQGRHYLDLADGSDFVEQIAQFDAAARAQQVFVLSGVSSFPVLSSAALAYLCEDGFVPQHVQAGIAPSPKAGVGLNVMRAVCSYAGYPIEITRKAEQQQAYAWCESRVFCIAPAGQIPLKPLRFSLVDVPDLREMVKIWPTLASVWMGAGVAPALYHRLFNVLSLLVRWRVLRSLKPLAGLMTWVMNHCNWGEHRGGMYLCAWGEHPKLGMQKRSLHLIAEGDDGLGIPSVPAEIIIRQVLQGTLPQTGARAALCAVRFQDYAQSFATKQIYSSIRVQDIESIDELTFPQDDMPQNTDASSSLKPTVVYREILADAFEQLAPSVQALHDWLPQQSRKVYVGQAKIERGTHLLVGLIAAIFRFPKANHAANVQLEFCRQGQQEQWLRQFDGQSMPSVQYVGQGVHDRLLFERIGLAVFAMAVQVNAGRLHLHIRRWWWLGLPMPLWLKPRIRAFEFEDDQARFNFFVEIALPILGLIVRYQGWLVAQSKSN